MDRYKQPLKMRLVASIVGATVFYVVAWIYYQIISLLYLGVMNLRIDFRLVDFSAGNVLAVAYFACGVAFLVCVTIFDILVLRRVLTFGYCLGLYFGAFFWGAGFWQSGDELHRPLGVGLGVFLFFYLVFYRWEDGLSILWLVQRFRKPDPMSNSYTLNQRRNILSGKTRQAKLQIWK